MKRLLPLCFIALLFVPLNLLAQSITPRDAFAGILPPTDPDMWLSLNGVWQLKVVEGVTDDTTVPDADDSWGEIPVPGCWEAYGFCDPQYGGAKPLTGYYRTRFALPHEWEGLTVALRLDGVFYAYDLWVNGQWVGDWHSAYNTALFDISDYLDPKAETQELALRVITVYPGSDFDYFDDWSLCGIHRDVSLLAVPQTHISDFTVETTDIQADKASVHFAFEVANGKKHTSIDASVLGPDGQAVASFSLPVEDGKASQDVDIIGPLLWTAETPALYTLSYDLRTKGKTLQTFNERFGIRQLTIDGNVLRLNGQAIKLRGVNIHATDPLTGKVIADSLTLKDMRMMKEASVNFLRMSHYPREPRLFELADSLGFYIVDEIPFGYGVKNLTQPVYYNQLKQRAQATLRRDKNHPSVLFWSVGNENPMTDITYWLGHYVVDTLKASKPICYPQIGSYYLRHEFEFPKVVGLYAPHYPTVSQLEGIYQQSDRPVVFTEYCHTLGTSLEDHDRLWEVMERTPHLAGGAVWEWVDQGFRFNVDEETRGGAFSRFGYEERVFTNEQGGFEMRGDKGTDGLLYADRTPLPNFYELQHNYAQASVLTDTLRLSPDQPIARLSVRNRFDFIDLQEGVVFRYALLADRDTIGQGSFTTPCPPHGTADVSLPLPSLPSDRRLSLHVSIAKADGIVINRQSIPINPQPLANRLKTALAETPGSNTSLPAQLLIRTGHKPTLTERLKVDDLRVNHYLQLIGPGQGIAKADISIDTLNTPGHATLYVIDYSLETDTTHTFLSEVGVALLMGETVDRVQWIGRGPWPNYPGRSQAGCYGTYALHRNDLYFEGNRMDVEAAYLSDADGNGLLIFADDPVNMNFEQTDQGVVLTCNAAVAGIGPKSSITSHPVFADQIGTLNGRFYVYPTSADTLPDILTQLFALPEQVAPPFKPFATQYDTYLMRMEDIVEGDE